MSSSVTLKELRGTIFLPTIPFDKKLSDKLSEYLQGFIPVLSFPMMIGSLRIEQQNGNWVMTTLDFKQKVSFLDGKIDYTYSYDPNRGGLDEFKSFLKTCANVFKVIMDYTQNSITRIAIAPSFIMKEDGKKIKSVISEYFEVNRFKDKSVDSCDFNQVYRNVENINGLEVTINYVSKFRVEQTQTLNDGIVTIEDSIAVDFDINTYPDPKIKFDKAFVDDFCEKSNDMCDEFMKLYSLRYE